MQDSIKNKLPKILSKINVIKIKLYKDFKNLITFLMEDETLNLVSKILSKISA